MKSSDREFIAESEDILGEAARLLIELQESGFNPDSINALFRAFHTLKGLSGLFGHKPITDFSHALESVLDDVRLGKIHFSDELIGFLFANLDALKKSIAGLKDGQEPDLAGFVEGVEDFRKHSAGGPVAISLKGLIDEAILKVLSEYEEHRLKSNVAEGKGVYILEKKFSIADFDTGLQAASKAIKSVGELLSTLPTSEGMPPDSIGFNLLFASSLPQEELARVLGEPPKELLKPKITEARPKAAQDAQSIKSASTTVRVDIEKLDRILNTIGELTLTKSAVKRVASELRDRFGHSTLVLDVYKISQSLEQRLLELQGQVLEIRMVPIGQIFGRLSQVIKRYSREAGKQIELAMYGEDTELDKYLAEEVIDPLVHIVRNAIDHGLELPEDRVKKGKPPHGTISMKAFQRGNHVVIEVSDDGRGIDFDAVARKAVEKGIIEKGAVLQKRELLELIFAPGFSTKDSVSEVSGRGVGLDIVRDKLSSMGGFSDVDTVFDKGTKFVLTLPITLAIIKALMIRVGTGRMAIPLTSISETHMVENSELKTIEGRKVYNLRKEMLPVTRLSEVFDIPADNSERSYVVIVGFGERRMGLIVDELLGQQEIVIKSLGEYFRGTRGFAGAAEIGRHEVILVVDIESVIEESLIRQKGMLHV
ncbi:MAG: chemotaxis protein CheA [Actinomycetota bacterium]|nr:chemotaxis protein CheA [Actinomycetota bacterium]